MNTATLAEFECWAASIQQRALAGMKTTTGEVYAMHLDNFIRATAAINVVLQFKEVQSTSATNTGAAV